jgi:hypothetical protein
VDNLLSLQVKTGIKDQSSIAAKPWRYRYKTTSKTRLWKTQIKLQKFGSLLALAATALAGIKPWAFYSK